MPKVSSAALSLLLITGCSGSLNHSIPIPKAAIQQGIDAFMPISSDDYIDQDAPVTVVADKATVLLTDGVDRIGVLLDLTVHLPRPGPNPNSERSRPPFGTPKNIDKLPAAIHGTINVWVGVRYEPSQASFYCHSPEIAELSFDELPARFDRPVREISQRLLARYLTANAVYKIKGDSNAEQLAAATLKNVEVSDGTLLVTVGP